MKLKLFSLIAILGLSFNSFGSDAAHPSFAIVEPYSADWKKMMDIAARHIFEIKLKTFSLAEERDVNVINNEFDTVQEYEKKLEIMILAHNIPIPEDVPKESCDYIKESVARMEKALKSIKSSQELEPVKTIYQKWEQEENQESLNSGMGLVNADAMENLMEGFDMDKWFNDYKKKHPECGDELSPKDRCKMMMDFNREVTIPKMKAYVEEKSKK